jgi:two-component system chemotaxis sensor kinase CheA
MTSDKAFQEFLSEAQETVENLNRTLLALDAGKVDPDLVNDAFRAVHTLKGLASLFGVNRMASLSHTLENLLDSLRLGRVAVSAGILDLLFEAVEIYGRLMAAVSEGRPAESPEVEGFVARLEQAARAGARAQTHKRQELALDPAILSVLSEYEEHRLRENISAGRTLYRVHAAFDMAGIDHGLEELKGRLKPVGEVITYLPTPDSSDGDGIELDVILATDVAQALVAAAVGARAEVSELVAGRVVPASPGRTEEDATLRSVSQTVRVDIRKLDHLMNLVGELTLARAGVERVLEELRAEGHLELSRRLQEQSRVLERKLDELQSGILEVRMVPLGQIFDKLSRVVRRISRDAGKEIRLGITGADTELDKLIVEELSDPLMHVIRNSIDHGIEPTDARRAAGKDETGTILVSAQQRGNHVVIEVKDDGRGFDEERILETAIGSGLLDAKQAADLSRRELLNLVFLPGFSTRERASEMSGRGVGLDVVKTNIARLSGIIDVASTPGKGTSLTITLPVTLAIIQALLIRAAGRSYAIPLNSVLETISATRADVRTIERREVLTVRGQTLALARVEQALDVPRAGPAPERMYVVVVGLAQHRLGLVVDDFIGQENIVIKSLSGPLNAVPGIAGATELGGQQVVLVLDVAALVEESLRGAEAA